MIFFGPRVPHSKLTQLTCMMSRSVSLSTLRLGALESAPPPPPSRQDALSSPSRTPSFDRPSFDHHTFHTQTYDARQSTLLSFCLVSHQFRQIAQPLLSEVVYVPRFTRLDNVLNQLEGSGAGFSIRQLAIKSQLSGYRGHVRMLGEDRTFALLAHSGCRRD
jgi:hypothetical protein